MAAPIGFAALAETWTGPNGERKSIRSRSLPRPASADLAALHPRGPVTIAPGDFERWLDCRAVDAGTVMALMTAPEEGEFAWHEGLNPGQPSRQ